MPEQIARSNKPELTPHWADEFYRRIDAIDPRAGEFWSDDIFVQCGNFPPTRGLAAFATGPFPRIVDAMSSVRHEILNRWDVADDQVVFEFIVHYVRKDGRPASLPAITTIHRNSDGYFDDLRLYMDAGPLLYGLSARLVGALQHDLPFVPDAEHRDWMRQIGRAYARNPSLFLSEVESCVIRSESDASSTNETLVRDLVLNGDSYSERIDIADDGFTVTRFRSDLEGDTHVRLNDANGAPVLSLQFDLRWAGVAPGSALLPGRQSLVAAKGGELLERLAGAAPQTPLA